METDVTTDHKENESVLTEQVIDSFAGTPDPRLRTLMQSLVRHIHAFVREVEPTEAEWMGAIRFLTETGKMCDDLVRQEFILLSDTLGVSMLVDSINHRYATGATDTTVFGPLYIEDRPQSSASNRRSCFHMRTAPRMTSWHGSSNSQALTVRQTTTLSWTGAN